MSSPETIVIGNGYVGACIAADHTLSRSSGTLRADVSDRAALVEVLAPLSDRPLVVHYLVAASEHTDAGYVRAYVQGLRHVLDALPRARVIFASSSGVYGQQDGSWVDETSPTEPARFNGKRMLEAEALLAGRGTAVRFGGIYGPGRTRLIDKVKRGDSIATSAWRNRIHRDDCAAVMEHVARLDDAAPLYVAVDDEPTEQREVQRWLCGELGIEEPQGTPPATGLGKRCRNALLKSSGYVFRYPTFRQGYGSVLRTPGLRNTGDASG